MNGGDIQDEAKTHNKKHLVVSDDFGFEIMIIIL